MSKTSTRTAQLIAPVDKYLMKQFKSLLLSSCSETMSQSMKSWATAILNLMANSHWGFEGNRKHSVFLRCKFSMMTPRTISKPILRVIKSCRIVAVSLNSNSVPDPSPTTRTAWLQTPSLCSFRRRTHRYKLITTQILPSSLWIFMMAKDQNKCMMVLINMNKIFNKILRPSPLSVVVWPVYTKNMSLLFRMRTRTCATICK